VRKWIFALIVPGIIAWLMIGNAAFGKTVTHDSGGSVMERAREIEESRNREIRVTGFCASACTLYLGMPNACTTNRARWLFHGPSGDDPFMLQVAAFMMADHYPEPIRSLFLADYQFREVTLRGSELIRVGAIAECK